MTGAPFGITLKRCTAALVLLTACQPGDGGSDDHLNVDTIGDTLVLHDQTPSQWSSPRRLELDLALGGVEEGSEPIFGRISNIAVGPSGAILVEDTQGNSVVRFGVDDHFSDSIGGRGEGPGEFLYPWGIAVLQDGRIVVRDNRLFSFSVYDPGGVFQERWPHRNLLRRSWGLEADRDGFLMVQVDFGDSFPFEPPNTGYVILSSEGAVVDSLPPPTTPWDGRELFGEYHPKKHFVRHASDYLVVGVSDAYHFHIRRPDRTIPVQQAYEPVLVSSSEKEAFDIEMAWRTRRGARGLEEMRPPPENKAAYRRILVTRTGDIWVFRHRTGEQWTTMDLGGGLIWPQFREPLLIDVFDEGGRFLGAVEGDANIDPRVVSNDTVWAVVTGEFDEQRVVRYLVR